MLLALAGLTAFFVGFFIGKDNADKPPAIVEEAREMTVDTIPYCAPKPQSELALGTHRYTLPPYLFPGGGSGGEPRCCSHNNKVTAHNDMVVTIPTNDTDEEEKPRENKDSVIVELPTMQRHYADSTYEAWVSGPVAPRLDSIRIFAPTTIITKREWKPPKRWHIGVTAGYGYGAKGFQPYIGIGITYSLFSF